MKGLATMRECHATEQAIAYSAIWWMRDFPEDFRIKGRPNKEALLRMMLLVNGIECNFDYLPASDGKRDATEKLRYRPAEEQAKTIWSVLETL